MVSDAFLIVLARIHDRARFASYVQALPPVYQQFGGRYLCVSPQAASFGSVGADCGPPQALVVSVWESMDRLREFWSSGEYRKVAELRADTGEFQVGAIEGDLQRYQLSSERLPCLGFCVDSVVPKDALTIASGELLMLEGETIGAQAQLIATAILPSASPHKGRWWFGSRI